MMPEEHAVGRGSRPAIRPTSTPTGCGPHRLSTTSVSSTSTARGEQRVGAPPPAAGPLGRRAVADRRRARAPADEQAAGVGRVVARHAQQYGGDARAPGAVNIAGWKEVAGARHHPRQRPASPTSAPPAATCATRSRRLEGELARTLAAVFPRREPARPGRSASAQAGPRLLTLGQLERIRDELAGRVAALHDRPRRGAAGRACTPPPPRHRWVQVTSAELGAAGLPRRGRCAPASARSAG